MFEKTALPGPRMALPSPAGPSKAPGRARQGSGRVWLEPRAFRSEGKLCPGIPSVDKGVVLRINQGFIQFMRHEYAQALSLKYTKKGIILSPKDNTPDPSKSDEVPLRNCDMR